MKRQYTRFCWVQRGNAVFALLETNELRTWPAASFEMLSAEPEVNNNKL